MNGFQPVAVDDGDVMIAAFHHHEQVQRGRPEYGFSASVAGSASCTREARMSASLQAGGGPTGA